MLEDVDSPVPGEAVDCAVMRSSRTERQSSLASLCNRRLSRSMLLPQSRQRCWLCMTGKN